MRNETLVDRLAALHLASETIKNVGMIASAESREAASTFVLTSLTETISAYMNINSYAVVSDEEAVEKTTTRRRRKTTAFKEEDATKTKTESKKDAAEEQPAENTAKSEPATTQAVKATEEPSPEDTPAPDAKAGEVLDFENDIKPVAVKALSVSRSAVVALLAQFKANKVTEVAQKDLGDFLKGLQGIIGEDSLV